MEPADTALIKLNAIAAEFQKFLQAKGRVSEADTRVKLIDKILGEVLQWPEAELSREDSVESGYTDYQLKVRRLPYVTVEAKKEGIAFVLPAGTSGRSLKLNGVLVTDPEIKSAINQVRGYCDDAGIKYAIATNGYTWIVFRAIRDDIPWREGSARIFSSIEFIQEHFVEFWNFLSYQAICQGSLDSEFGRGLPASRKLLRVIDKLFNADLPLRRNRLNSQLQPIITYIFEDIAANNDLNLLSSCYVHTGSLKIVADDLNVVITDAIPQPLADEGTAPIVQSVDDAGDFGLRIEKAILQQQGELYLLLGGIGSGKTTFLKRYQKLLAKDLLEQKTYTFHLDFLKAPLDVDKLEGFVWNEILDNWRLSHQDDEIEERRYLKKIFKEKLLNLERTALRGVSKGSDKYETAISPYLFRWQEDIPDYVPRLLKYASAVKGKSIVLFIDNVDQLDPEYQAQIFLLSQRVTRLIGSVTIIALREESYYAPSIQNAFTAYNTHKFHIASPQFRKMIENRIEYAIQTLERSDEKYQSTVLRGHEFDTRDISEFLRIVETSVFRWSRKISNLIECLCFGNMRLALQMFTTFLTSGATDVDKMLFIYRREGSYYVAFHEFLKSIMLQDRAYYKEEQSPIFNLFNCTGERNSSHFTALRILATLVERRRESNPEGQGYVELSRLIGSFADVFDNVRDVTTILDRLVKRQLIEVNTRSTTTVAGASHTRVTAAGWYYVKHLSCTFPYLDLVLQDTPLNNDELEESLRRSVYEVNNLADREHEKLKRMQARFDRTQNFIDYLAEEENHEFDIYQLDHIPGVLGWRFMPRILGKFRVDRTYIENKLREGRAGDVLDESLDEDNLVQDNDLDLDATEKGNSTNNE